MNWQPLVAIALVVAQGVLAAIIVAKPETLGVSQQLLSWLAIANVAVGITLNQLEKVQHSQPPPDPPKN